MVKKVLVVDDERVLAETIGYNLRREGYAALAAHDGEAALEAARRERPDAIILDVMLPRLDGFEVCRALRRESAVPILLLTARDDEIDKVVGLELGADDYLTKPFSMRELQARVGALLRRVDLLREHSRTAEADEPIVLPDLRLDPATREVVSAGRPVQLTAKEFDLLRLLAGNPGRVFSREYLLDRVWGSDYAGFDRTVDTHILRLRKKLGPAGERIATLWGVGYKFERGAG